MSTARRHVDQIVYDLLLSAYREQPGAHTHASHRAGCGTEAAKRSYEKGWPKRNLRPIRTVLNEEWMAAKAAAAREARQEQEALAAQRRTDAVDAAKVMKDEAKLLANARMSIATAGLIVQKLWPGISRLADELAAYLQTGAAIGSPADSMRALRTLREFGVLVKQQAEALGEVVRSERLHSGKPTEISEINVNAPTLEEALVELSRVQEVLRLANARGVELPSEAKAVIEGVPVAADEPDQSTRN